MDWWRDGITFVCGTGKVSNFLYKMELCRYALFLFQSFVVPLNSYSCYAQDDSYFVLKAKCLCLLGIDSAWRHT